MYTHTEKQARGTFPRPPRRFTSPMPWRMTISSPCRQSQRSEFLPCLACQGLMLRLSGPGGHEVRRHAVLERLVARLLAPGRGAGVKHAHQRHHGSLHRTVSWLCNRRAYCFLGGSGHGPTPVRPCLQRADLADDRGHEDIFRLWTDVAAVDLVPFLGVRGGVEEVADAMMGVAAGPHPPPAHLALHPQPDLRADLALGADKVDVAHAPRTRQLLARSFVGLFLSGALYSSTIPASWMGVLSASDSALSASGGALYAAGVWGLAAVLGTPPAAPSTGRPAPARAVWKEPPPPPGPARAPARR